AAPALAALANGEACHHDTRSRNETSEEASMRRLCRVVRLPFVEKSLCVRIPLRRTEDQQQRTRTQGYAAPQVGAWTTPSSKKTTAVIGRRNLTRRRRTVAGVAVAGRARRW
ncbi:unnamed protein product, partial [Ectocarpus sp. 4 AP-2014]